MPLIGWMTAPPASLISLAARIQRGGVHYHRTRLNGEPCSLEDTNWRDEVSAQAGAIRLLSADFVDDNTAQVARVDGTLPR